ncbi:MAG: biotin transporter BioY [Clostridia bacterium]|nr:biotin transporter BioY [Clostridia bacterium]
MLKENSKLKDLISKLNDKKKKIPKRTTIMLTLIPLFTCLIIAGTFMKVNIGVVPITMQTFFVQLTSSILGPYWGALAVCLYILMGLIGIPIFSGGGGFMYVTYPTFGYIIGFLIGTIVGGLIIKSFKKKTYVAYLVGNLVNLLIIYACGMFYYYMIKSFVTPSGNITAYTIFISLFLIFLPGDTIFMLLGSYIATRVKPILEKMIVKTATEEDIKEYEQSLQNSDIECAEAEIVATAIEDTTTTYDTNDIENAFNNEISVNKD